MEPSGPVQACNGIALPFNVKQKSCKQMTSQMASVCGFRETRLQMVHSETQYGHFTKALFTFKMSYDATALPSM